MRKLYNPVDERNRAITATQFIEKPKYEEKHSQIRFLRKQGMSEKRLIEIYTEAVVREALQNA